MILQGTACYPVALAIYFDPSRKGRQFAGNRDGFEEARDPVISDRPAVAAGRVTECAGGSVFALTGPTGDQQSHGDQSKHHLLGLLLAFVVGFRWLSISIRRDQSTWTALC